MNYAALIERDIQTVSDDVNACARIAHASGLILKVIVETCYLTASQIIESLKICEDAHADFIKTSTGFGTAGATPEHVALMAEHRSTDIRIKAAGGMKSAGDALDMIRNGATRLGASRAKVMLDAFKSR